MWQWHIYLGYALGILLVWRLAMAWKNGGLGYVEPDLHMRLLHWGYRILYLPLAVMVLTGLIAAFYKDLGIAKDSIAWAKELHETVAWAIIAFVPVHIAVVVIADNTDQKWIVSKMISG